MRCLAVIAVLAVIGMKAYSHGEFGKGIKIEINYFIFFTQI